MSSRMQLFCPQCRRLLKSSTEAWECASCEKRWPVVHGVPYFVESAPYWGESGIPQEAAQGIVQEMMAGRNWHEVVRNHSLAGVRDRYRFIADLGRARGHTLARLGPESVALDYGAGLGTFSQALAQSAGLVVSVDQVEERVQFMKLRFQQDGCGNVEVVRADINGLPFSDRSFDLIVLNGVLEWLPFSRKSENPRKAQLYYLKKLWQYVKPGGQLYLGIENRWSYHLLRGAPDPHILLRYVAVLPRPLADVVCRIKTGDRYRPYIYSHRGYGKLLREAGFATYAIYAAIPSYASPQRLLDLRTHSREFDADVWTTRNPLSRLLRRFLLHMDYLKYFGPAYIILARKPAG